MVEVVTDDRPLEAAAQRLAAMLTSVEGDPVRLAIPGGSAAAVAPRALQIAIAYGFDAGRLALTWVDERCVPVASADSNRGAVRFDPAPGLELPLFVDGEAPADAVVRVEGAFETLFGGSLDVSLLGMGPDGHVASLFVGGPELAGTVAHIADSPKPPADRITLTRRTLATARQTLVFATGEGKREAIERLVAGDPSLPATGLPGLVLVTDLTLGPDL
ncbi:6-phosphogluconolactonase [Engelhardtia mirabilis]|uniref:6-phosphogluconolactonase n=1 Tax=Engelhardtia mirabilis TaxID=2528011 RepID=A0A518BED9_9BACT|nr:6-phosphogluconolactonase [Planctomycetes bacterium Pla133]QDU99683.1 6-phosphogluconolactonase [Planctomycetes bacterium Pla86]